MASVEMCMQRLQMIKKKTHQSSDRGRQPVNSPDDTRLELVDQTGNKRERE